MRNTLHIRIGVSVGLIASLFALAGCGNHDSATAPPPQGGTSAAVSNRPAMPERARALAAMQAQGAAADGKRAAAAMAAASKH